METQKIWDMTFKTLLIETPNLFLPLIKEVFGVEYERKSEVILCNTEFYNKDGSRIIADTSFCIADKRYHFECQFSNEKDMVVRVFEYDFHIGMSELKKKQDYLEFNFPRSCVVYVSNNKSNPTKLKMKLNFQDGTTKLYEIPTIRIQDYSISEIEKKQLELFLPFLILRYRNQWNQKKKPTLEEMKQFYKEMIEVITLTYEEQKLSETEYLSLIGAIRKTGEYELEKEEEIWKGVNKMMTELLEIPELETLKREVKKAEMKGKKEGKKEATMKILIDMYQDGINMGYIIKVANKNGILEEEFLEVLNRNGISR